MPWEPLPPPSLRDWCDASIDAFLLIWPVLMMIVAALVVTP